MSLLGISQCIQNQSQNHYNHNCAQLCGLNTPQFNKKKEITEHSIPNSDNNNERDNSNHRDN
ncbi:24843_t:CDS:2, partial [Racocetra persica]